MLQEIISYISTLDPALIYFALFLFAFIENIFPPSPSDLVLVVGSAIVANTPAGFLPVLVLTSIGSGLGFIVMYYTGNFLGDKLLRKGKLKFIKQESLDKADIWFNKYGYKIILINRFIPGTRAVISFFCGVHKLKPLPTFFFAALSSLLWNSALIWLGIFLGRNIELIDSYLSTYSNIALVIAALAALYFIYKYLRRNRSSK